MSRQFRQIKRALGCDLYTVHRSVGQFHLNEQFIIIEDTAINKIFKLTRPKKLKI